MCKRLLSQFHTRSGLEICNDCVRKIYNLLKVNKLKFNDQSNEIQFECDQCSFNQQFEL